MISKEEAIRQVTENEYIRTTLLDGVPSFDSKFAECQTDEERISLVETYSNMLFMENVNEKETDGAGHSRRRNKPGEAGEKEQEADRACKEMV